MAAAGIVCEFNPFHEGHRYLIEQTRKAGAERIVCVMSGNFVQRGVPAVKDKFERAADAVKGGADLVLELPSVYAVNSADFFARGAVRILNRLGCVDMISFGSECGDLDLLEKCSEQMLAEDEAFSGALKKHLADGLSYPQAYSKAASGNYSEECSRLLANPNDTLALCYLREIKRQGTEIKGFTVKRTFPYSGSAIRKDIAADPDRISFEDRLFAVVRSAVLSSPSKEIADVCEVSEGLENRVVTAISKAQDLEGFVKAVKSSRYTYAKVSRILMQLLLGITKDTVREAELAETAYAKVLALNGTGAGILRDASAEGNISIISNINKTQLTDASENRLLGIDIKSSDLYSILCGREIYEFSDRVRIPIIMKI